MNRFNSSILNVVLKSFRQTLVDSGMYSDNSIFIVIDNNIEQTFPNMSPPFCTISVGSSYNLPETDGGDTYVKGWSTDIIVKPVVRNIMNYPYLDSSVTLSNDLMLGILENTQQIINNMEQTFVSDDNNNLVLRELPISTTMEEPRRYADSYEYVTQPIVFNVSWNQDILSIAIIDYNASGIISGSGDLFIGSGDYAASGSVSGSGNLRVITSTGTGFDLLEIF